MNKQSFNGKCRFYLRPEYVKIVNFQIKNSFDSFTSARSRTNFTSYQKILHHLPTVLPTSHICQQQKTWKDWSCVLVWQKWREWMIFGHGRPIHLENKIWIRFNRLRSRVERVSLPCNLLAVIMFFFSIKLIHTLMIQLYFVIFKYVPIQMIITIKYIMRTKARIKWTVLHCNRWSWVGRFDYDSTYDQR